MIDDVNPLRLLLSARDPAAAHAVRNLVERACADLRFSVQVIASSPASEFLKGLPCECFALPMEVSTAPEKLSLAVTHVLEQVRPDAIIAGASGPDAGVDEVLVKQAGRVRSYVIQDFWGDVNLTLDAPPDCYLVIDSLAAELTQQRVDSEIFVVGSVKHASYAALNVSTLRSSRRGALGVGEDEPVIGYFGMPLGGLQGYWRTLEALAESLQDWPIKLVYRPHPKEDEHVRGRTCEILSSIELFSEDKSVCVEETLAACDLILSCYSSCGIDSEMLGRNLAQDNRLSVFLLHDAEILEYYQRYTRLDDLPPSLQKRSLTIKDRSALKETMRTFLSVESRLEFLGSELRPSSAGGSVYRVLNKVFMDCSLLGSTSGNQLNG